MRYILVLIIVFSFGCKSEKKDRPKYNPLKGNWAFLDIRGNYNEAFFSDSTYITFNMVYGLSPEFRYILKNDSMYASIYDRRYKLRRIAKLTVITPDSIILVTEFSRDTLGRMAGEKVTLENTDPRSDSALFRQEVYRRYENFLLDKGIIKPEEVEEFKKNKTIPEDVLKQQ